MAKYVGFKIGKVHESHVISEYYCAGCGWPVTDHDSFCPECGGAFRERDADEVKNAKLRDICSDMLRCIDARKDRRSICWGCTHHRPVDELRNMCFLNHDARELGIEVDK